MSRPSLHPETAFRLAAVLGAVGVALGAFGAHAMKDRLAAFGTADIWEKAVFYQFIHTVMLCVLPGRQPFPAAAWWSFLIGIGFFSGSLYLLAATDIKWLGAITPVGGVAFLAGWIRLAWPRKHPEAHR